MDIYLGLGSNLGDRSANLAHALDELAAAGLRIARVSPLVESPALLPDDAPTDWNRPFLNLVAECGCDATPHELLDLAKRVEQVLGRGEHARWSPRAIDIDILLYGRDEIATDRARIPHPGVSHRAFVLSPLAMLAPRLTIPGRGTATVLEWSRRAGVIPIWMGIVNLTPDSFSDGGELSAWDVLDAHVDAMLAAGAQIVDLGAESTRPGATALSADAEWTRLEQPLARLVAKHGGARVRPLFSVDTYHPETARRALAAGADMINDVSGLTEPAMLELAATSGKDWVAMHHVSVPADRERVLPPDQDPGEAVERWLAERIREWERAGLDLERIVFDPGIGFGKNPLQSLKLLRHMRRFERYGLRCLVGHSRKSFMQAFAGADKAERDLFTLGASLALCAQGVEILRVHNVPAHVAAYRGWAHVGRE
ncbi:MAG TPA: dihydropteroate synthase [Gammaproteobacteria bacterium]|nr:dihydropteroate synthase [Gammaproteobacteria bacterium]